MPTTTSPSRGQVYPPIEPDLSIKPPPAPSMEGVDVTEHDTLHLLERVASFRIRYRLAYLAELRAATKARTA